MESTSQVYFLTVTVADFSTLTMSSFSSAESLPNFVNAFAALANSASSSLISSCVSASGSSGGRGSSSNPSFSSFFFSSSSFATLVCRVLWLYRTTGKSAGGASEPATVQACGCLPAAILLALCDCTSAQDCSPGPSPTVTVTGSGVAGGGSGPSFGLSVVVI